jgi:hypothetical protein
MYTRNDQNCCTLHSRPCDIAHAQRRHACAQEIVDWSSYRVTTSLVIFSGDPWPRASPKSASFICPSRPNNKLAGFRSTELIPI